MLGQGAVAYAYDVARALPVVLQETDQPVVGQPTTRKYVWGLGPAYSVDRAVAVDHPDGLGSVRALTDATGALVRTYQADEFGVTIQSQGTGAQRLQYAGEERDEDGLIYLRARYYNSALGRFMGRDSSLGLPALPPSLNRYSYVVNDPPRFRGSFRLGSFRSTSRGGHTIAPPLTLG